jgi:hypothetical protein
MNHGKPEGSSLISRKGEAKPPREPTIRTIVIYGTWPRRLAMIWMRPAMPDLCVPRPRPRLSAVLDAGLPFSTCGVSSMMPSHLARS